MKAFVAGATGLTGREVVQQLRAAGDDVVAHVRPDSRRIDAWTERFTEQGATVDTSAWTDETMHAAMNKHAPDVVFALLGTTRKRGRAAKAQGKDETYETVDYGLSALLLRAAQSVDDVRFVYLSSMGVTPTTRNAYLAVRHRLETELRESGVSWGIARPSFIAGDRDEHRMGESLGIAVGDGALALVGALGGKRLRERYRSQTNVELARALIAIGKDRALGLVESDQLRELGVV